MSNTQLRDIHAAIEALQRLASAFGERREQLAESVGLTEHQWGVLEEISTEHFMPSMFARKRDSSPAAVSKTIRQLVDKGLVEVTLSKSDARQRDYQLTGQAKRALGQLRRARARAIEQIWLRLDIGRVRAFTTFANQLTDALLQHASKTRQQKDGHGNHTLREGI